jgi:GH24 family phage-related lysozyme (muramidase)
MNIDKLREELKVDEGVKYEIYLDHLGLPTFGIGHLVLDSDVEHGQEVELLSQKIESSKRSLATSTWCSKTALRYTQISKHCPKKSN